MKKTMVYILALSMLVVTLLAGCGEMGGSGNGTTDQPATTTDLLPDVMEPDVDDGVVNDDNGIITDGDNGTMGTTGGTNGGTGSGAAGGTTGGTGNGMTGSTTGGSGSGAAGGTTGGTTTGGTSANGTGTVTYNGNGTVRR